MVAGINIYNWLHQKHGSGFIFCETQTSSWQEDIIYTSFIRPILEYADVVWCNLTKYQKDELKKIQFEAARIVTGVTKLTSHDNLCRETCWETLNSRRKQQKLTLYYKMIFLTLPYLISLVPPRVGDMSSYSLINSDKYKTIEPWLLISNNLNFWQVRTRTSLCSLLLSLETPNCVQSVA